MFVTESLSEPLQCRQLLPGASGLSQTKTEEGGEGKLHILDPKSFIQLDKRKLCDGHRAPGSQFLVMTVTLLRAILSILCGTGCFSQGSWHRRSLHPGIFHGLSRDVQPSL